MMTTMRPLQILAGQNVRGRSTYAGKRTEEGFRIFTEEELKLNQGGGMYPTMAFTCRHTALSF